MIDGKFSMEYKFYYLFNTHVIHVPVSDFSYRELFDDEKKRDLTYVEGMNLLTSKSCMFQNFIKKKKRENKYIFLDLLCYKLRKLNIPVLRMATVKPAHRVKAYII